MTNQIRLTRYRAIPWWIVLAFVVCLAFFVFGPGSAAAQDKKPTIIPIDVPEAMVTVAFDNNQAGQVVGTYVDEAAPTVNRGFLRDKDGKFTYIDYPGAYGTQPVSINTDGVITGYYFDTSGKYVAHGFLYDHGHYTLIEDIPGAVSGSPIPPYPGATCPGASCTYYGTETETINSEGMIAGVYLDGTPSSHGFLRYPWGEITYINDPSAAESYLEGTSVVWPAGINAAGTVAGWYIDSRGVYHGFLYERGHFTEIDAPDAGSGSGQGTEPSGMNDEGAVAGSYSDSSYALHGFVWDQYGKLIEFDYIDPITGIKALATAGVSIDPEGVVTGEYFDGTYLHGFVRDRHGNFTSFDGASNAYYTYPVNICPSGQIAGFYIDADGNYHGFLLIP